MRIRRKARPATRARVPVERPRVLAELLGSGVFDLAHYQAQTGEPFAGEHDAAAHYVARGAAAGLTPNPLLDVASLPPGLATRVAEGRVGALLRYLRRRGLERSLGPLFDARALSASRAAAEAHPGGALGLFLQDSDDDSPLPGCPALTLGTARWEMRAHATSLSVPGAAAAAPGPSWDDVVQALPSRAAGRTSVVIATRDDWAGPETAATCVLESAAAGAVEVLVVDRASSRPVAARLRAVALAEPRLRYLRLRTSGDEATAFNAGVRHSTGATVLLLHHDAEPAADCLPRLLGALAPDAENSDGSADVLGVQPLLLRPDDSIECAGLVVPRADGLPVPFLAGHPPEDALRMTDRAFPAVSATALLMRAGDLVELRGLDGSLGELAGADLCLRAARLRRGRFLVEPAARAWHHDDHPATDPDTQAEHRRRFLERWRGALPATGPRQAPPSLVVRRSAVPGRLRWGLVLASPGGPEGSRWGDTHFGESLARALRAGGQEVVTYRHGAHDRGTASLDDVVLGIRGLDPVRPVPGAVSVLWVISHPDEVDPAELQDFDLVFAASAPWAREMTDRSGRPVGVLPQATDVSRRADLRRPVGSGDLAVFVGTTHGRRPRRIVADALAAGVPFRAFGPWRGRIPDELVGGGYVPNDRLGSLYREYGLVLADHHADMAHHGFLANRLYDAVASGARVVTDPVVGLEAFEGAVQPYHDRAELAFLCSPQGRARFPDDETMAAIADRVALAHSFDARAGVLLEAVLDVRRSG